MKEHALVIRLVHYSNIKSYILNLNTYAKLPLECIIKVTGVIRSLYLYLGIKITGNGGSDREEWGPFHSETEKTKGNFRDSLPQLLLLLCEAQDVFKDPCGAGGMGKDWGRMEEDGGRVLHCLKMQAN